MELEFLRAFSKDLDHIQEKSVKRTLIRTIEQLESAKSLSEINNVKKLTGFKHAYRIRIGNYRLGFFVDGYKVQLARFLHRKDIYKLFP